jgi:hypothetical protein
MGWVSFRFIFFKPACPGLRFVLPSRQILGAAIEQRLSDLVCAMALDLLLGGGLRTFRRNLIWETM